jgi:hypothetical protein
MTVQRRRYSANGEERARARAVDSQHQRCRRPIMSDYYHGPEDPFRRDDVYDPNVRSGGSAWGWLVAALFLVVVLAMVFGIGHQAGQPGTSTASNDPNPPATRMAPPATRMAPPAATPSNGPPTTTAPAPANPAPPIAPAPGTPAQEH